jgi:DNA-binding transcriptional LysR family regulator
VTFKVSDDFANPITQNIDLAIRIGNLTDSRLMSRLLGYSRRVVIAAPEYLARHGTPEHPNDLKKHACIVWTGGREGGSPEARLHEWEAAVVRTGYGEVYNGLVQGVLGLANVERSRYRLPPPQPHSQLRHYPWSADR